MAQMEEMRTEEKVLVKGSEKKEGAWEGEVGLNEE
jgi:hypothetical protein